MGKETSSKRYNSFWTFSRIRSIFDNFFRKSNGFTLVELLVVIGIIGILVAAALLVLNPIAQFQKANDAKRKGDLAQIQRALEIYYHDLGKYPQSSSDYKIIYNANTASWGSNLFMPYMNSLPQDPTPGRTYVYFSTPSNNPQSYYLYASLERDNDPQLCNKGSACSSLANNGIPSLSCGKTCNFGVSSSNVNP